MSTEDGIEKLIGRFGKYQTWVLILIGLGRFPTEFQLINVVFILPSVDFVCLDEQTYNLTNHCPCENPRFDVSATVSSVTSEWNLICDRRTLASLAQSMLQVGILVGSVIFGYISDRYGRKLAVLIALFLEAAFVASSGLVPEFWMFLVCRFLIGTAVGGTMLCCYVLLIELSGKTFMPHLTGLSEVSLVVSYFILPIIAYFVREWRMLQLITSVPWLLVIVFYWLIPESPRWLITVGKKKEAVDLLKYIAKKNNRPTDKVENVVDEIEKESLKENDEKRGSYLDLFKTPKIRIYTIIMAFVWMCCSHTFFGMNQFIGTLEGNLYLNVMLSAASLAPGLVLAVIATVYLKRKVSVIGSFMVAAVALFVMIFIPNTTRYALLVFAIIGQIGAYNAFCQIYLYSSEIFPTMIRNSAIGFASVFARFGGFIAPFVVNIRFQWLSVTIFSAIALCAAILCIFLPETKGKVLFNSIQQAEKSHSNNLNTSQEKV